MAKPTITDVAKYAGVSPSAVSLYLNKRPGIGREAQERIAEAIDELGYVPRNNASRNKSNGFIGLVVEKLPGSLTGDLFYADIATGIQQRAEALGYNVAITIVNESTESVPRLMDEESVAGLIAIGGGDITDNLLQHIINNNTPLVAVDNHSNLQPIDSVVVDNYRGAYLAVQHLVELGHQRIAVIRGPEKYKSLTERFYGYLHAIVDAKLGIDPSLIQIPLSKGIPNKGYLEMRALLNIEDPPTAVFAVSDRTALGAISALREFDLKIPDDISIVGFDDLPPHSYSEPALTSVTSQRLEMGRIAMQRLHEIINDPSLTPIKISMPTGLVVRDSSTHFI